MISKDLFQSIEKLLLDYQYELVDALVVSQNGRWVLRVFIDHAIQQLGSNDPQQSPNIKSRVSIEDCARATRILVPFLESVRELPGQYELEVSSPGIDRALKKQKDYARCVGQKVRIALDRSFWSDRVQKNFSGVLLGCTDSKIKIKDVVSGEVEIPLEWILKAKLES